jgi:hypothetical protein
MSGLSFGLGGQEGDLAAGSSGEAGQLGMGALTESTGAPVEDDQGAAIQVQAAQVLVQLSEAVLEWVALALTADFEFDRLPLNGGSTVGVGIRLADQQVDPAPANPEVPVDEATCVDDPLEICQENQLGRVLVIALVLGQNVRVRAPERCELFQQPAEAQSTVRKQEAGRADGDRMRSPLGWTSNDDLPVNGLAMLKTHLWGELADVDNPGPCPGCKGRVLEIAATLTVAGMLSIFGHSHPRAPWRHAGAE